MNLANEGLEARKKDDEVAARKRKAEEDKAWEGGLFYFPIYLLLISSIRLKIENRDERVDSWRSFSNTKKKKKSKVAILG